MKLSVIYESVTNNTATMARYIADGMNKVEGVEAKAFSIDAVDEAFAKDSSGFVFGTPVYGGGPSAKFYTYMEKEAPKLGLAGKLGGAFATEQYIHGGADATIISILEHLLVYGMMVYSSGASKGRPVIHFGPVEVSPNTEDFRELFEIYGTRFAEQTKQVIG